MRNHPSKKRFPYGLVSGLMSAAMLTSVSAQMVISNDEAALKTMLKEIQADEAANTISQSNAEKAIAIILNKIKADEAAAAAGVENTNSTDVPLNDIFKKIRAGEAARAMVANTNNTEIRAEGADEKWSHFFDFHKVTADDDWTRHMRIGAVVGLNISANFRESGVFKISGNGAANGNYDDGYVLEDQTGNAGGTTGNWGYNNSSQYNAAAQTLTMHGATTYATSASSSDAGGPFVGFDMDYGATLFYWQRVRVGWDLGFDLMPMKITDDSSFSATVNETDYIYNTGGIVMPGAPYRGGSSGLGPQLPDSPASETQSVGVGTITGSRSLDMMLYSIRLGPQFYWDFSPKISMSVGLGPAVGFLTSEYKYNEIITTGNSSSQNSGSFSADNMVVGGYVNATLMYHLDDQGKKADLFLSAQYMPMGKATISSDGREAQVNLNGQVYLSAGISWPF